MEGAQGQFAEKDNESNETFFELRNYDPLLGRFNTIDPYGQYFSPYLAMGNSHPNMIDPDGGFGGPFGGGYTASNPFLGTAGVGGGGTSGLQILGTTAGILGVAALGNAFAFQNAVYELSNSKHIINLHNPNEPLAYNLARYWKGNGDLNTFYVFGHAETNRFRYTDDNGVNQVKNYKATELHEILKKKNSLYKKLIDSGKPITLVCLQCYVGANEKAIGAELSKLNNGQITVIAPDGYLTPAVMGTTTRVHGVDNLKGSGNVNTFKNGKIIKSVPMYYKVRKNRIKIN